MALDPTTGRLFAYPQSVLGRRHGPRGYFDYVDYKPWLRDEFQFRCVYCLCRERWFANGDEAFSVDHIQPQSRAPALVCRYDNLVYACCHCNSAKRNVIGVPDPCQEPFGQHLEVLSDGRIRGLTIVGLDVIHICRLDRPRLTEFRRRMMMLFRLLVSRQDEEGRRLRQAYFGYPENLPRLSTLRPPAGNARPASVSDCFFERRRVGRLSDVY